MRENLEISLSTKIVNVLTSSVKIVSRNNAARNKEKIKFVT